MDIFFSYTYTPGLISETIREDDPRMDVRAVPFGLQRAAAGTKVAGTAFPAQRRHIFFIPQPKAERMIPDRIPLIRQDIAHRLIPGLAGENIPVRLDTHAVLCRRTGFISDTGGHRIKIAWGYTTGGADRSVPRRISPRPAIPAAGRYGSRCQPLSLYRNRSAHSSRMS